MKELNRILYVEDQQDIQMIARVALESIGGFELKTCISGEDALDVIAGYAPDLLLLDVMMPGLDGPETLAEVRKLPECKEMPVIFMTAKALPGEIQGLMDLGALGVIVKPFDPVTLGDDIRKLWKEQD